MDNNNFIYFIFICIITHIIRSVYEILKHKKIIIPNKLSFIIIFINMAILWTSWFLLCRFDQSEIYLPSFIHYSGIALIITGLIMFLIALFTIKTLETYEGGLIINGIYSRIRHPMYLSFVFWLIGLPIFYGVVYSFIIAIPFFINILFWRHLEEIELVNRFSDYESYKSKTYF